MRSKAAQCCGLVLLSLSLPRLLLSLLSTTAWQSPAPRPRPLAAVYQARTMLY